MELITAFKTVKRVSECLAHSRCSVNMTAVCRGQHVPWAFAELRMRVCAERWNFRFPEQWRLSTVRLWVIRGLLTNNTPTPLKSLRDSIHNPQNLLFLLCSKIEWFFLLSFPSTYPIQKLTVILLRIITEDWSSPYVNSVLAHWIRFSLDSSGVLRPGSGLHYVSRRVFRQPTKPSLPPRLPCPSLLFAVSPARGSFLKSRTFLFYYAAFDMWNNYPSE